MTVSIILGNYSLSFITVATVQTVKVGSSMLSYSPVHIQYSWISRGLSLYLLYHRHLFPCSW